MGRLVRKYLRCYKATVKSPYSGLSVLADLGSGKTITTRVNPALIEVDDTKNWYPSGTATQVNADVWGLCVRMNLGLLPTGDFTCLRLEGNTKGLTLVSAIDIPIGGVPSGNIDYLLTVNPGNTNAWKATGAIPGSVGAMGWIRVRVAGIDRYIQLYGAV